MGKLRQKEREVKTLQETLKGKNRQITWANVEISKRDALIKGQAEEIAVLKAPKETVDGTTS